MAAQPDSPVVADFAAWRERQAWRRAAEHLNSTGLAACVPCGLVAWLRRHGLDVWCIERRSAA